MNQLMIFFPSILAGLHLVLCWIPVWPTAVDWSPEISKCPIVEAKELASIDCTGARLISLYKGTRHMP